MTEHVKLETLALDAGYQGRPVVSQAEFAVRSGEILVLLGPNGAGKSTLMKAVIGFLRYDGTITVGGYPNKTTDAKRIMGYIPEMPSLPAQRTSSALRRMRA